MIYVVLGMHKSGTTMVAKLLHHSGIQMIEDDDDDGSYDAGFFYERATTKHLNKQMLGWDSSRMIDRPTPMILDTREPILQDMEALVSAQQKAAHDWGFKDPRTALTYEVWQKILPAHRLVAVYRPIQEIWPRYRYDGLRYYHTNPNLAWALVQRWCEYNQRILNALHQAADRAILFQYGTLLVDDGEIRRLESFIDLPVVDGRNRKLRRGSRKLYPLLLFMLRLAETFSPYSPARIQQELDRLYEEQSNHFRLETKSNN